MAVYGVATDGVSSEKMTGTRPTWAEVSRSRLNHNHDILRRLAGPETALLAVVKANAYGHGLQECARVLENNGARWLGVTSVEEGVALRQVCADTRILIMSGIGEAEADAAIEHNLTPVVWEKQHLDWLEEAARRQGKAEGKVPVHLEVDTGMSRQGVAPKGVAELAGRMAVGSPLHLEAVMTHFHSPDDVEETKSQVEQYLWAAATLLQQKISCEFMSAGSSANLMFRSGLENVLASVARTMRARRMIRSGIAFYGYSPLPRTDFWLQERKKDGVIDHDIQLVLSWKTRVTSLREVAPPTTVGYGGTFRVKRPTRLALLPVGYADGLSRQLSNKGWVLVRGQKAPIAGRISMDHTTVDVTGIVGVALGDEVVIIGEQGAEKITADDVADLRQTISYEVLCDIGARVPRVMVD
jgi:alanine racemase